ncbi:bifunctional 2-methylcitrate synthase/citrate synthase [Mycobacterium sp. CBMA293]|uniref:bifunctional 2-methylcitrate synthase/citrate synthase n=1 Tax=unclassified Mycolicibacterium TaxID=2636767 RepID=UPI0012DCC541|nr:MULTISPECIES: bifunctional 2-methylcitrate synthase/citrate synthase [unclassified Mycolicibacterium]MUL46146.1 bifunctional 2-methylcitrate synthase/citrate synthase [Mycolicibacterium sp. CBMA 360]MUL58805.1 bifunctional 2-methylcitrate synthase/citrate synthase [Mycolicibacterium sp. CBMA 335]MUL69199.1 bifunctional 2-methylcitrate synthase/citrate synthase [Mycolicibacterium sp. CBMA 311]MUL94163.1 bifunctional 2-methylcitrate synthase/citrate synthase [Mycolicibacterium sp. CBMA 230]MU
MTATAATEASRIHKGLAGVVVDTTAISKVVPETNSLTYRGYPVQELAARCSFEQVAYLLWHGELPTEQELAMFCQRERASRRVDRSMYSLLAKLPESCHPMDVVRTAISYLGAEDPEEDDSTVPANYAKSLRMLAVLPTIVAADIRRRQGLSPIAPHSQLGYSENFLNMCFGSVPERAIVDAFNQSMVLYAEHSFNASTFTARVVTSTQSDIYSAVTAAIGALKGSLHGGANEAVMHDMLEIGSAENASKWLHGKLSRKDKVMGFGHRVYKNGDSRVPTMKAAFERVVEARGGQQWLDIYNVLERDMFAATGIKPNLDFPTGPAYYLMGFDIPVFTPLFVMSRITGWTAHIMEQAASNALIRPLSEYSGQPQRSIA